MAPVPSSSYDSLSVSHDILGMLQSLQITKAAIVGHDWGALITYFLALYSPQTFPAVFGISVPHILPKKEAGPLLDISQKAGDDFHYILYHNEPHGRAEKEYDARPRDLLKRLYCGGSVRSARPLVTDKHRSAGGWIDRLGEPLCLPEWLTEDDLNYYVTEFTRTGFAGGVNYYRNMHRNWQHSHSLRTNKIMQPMGMMIGSKDMVLANFGGIDAVRKQMKRSCPNLVGDGVVLVEGAGHWLQQERAEQVSAAVLTFLNTVYAPKSHL